MLENPETLVTLPFIFSYPFPLLLHRYFRFSYFRFFYLHRDDNILPFPLFERSFHSMNDKYLIPGIHWRLPLIYRVKNIADAMFRAIDVAIKVCFMPTHETLNICNVDVFRFLYSVLFHRACCQVGKKRNSLRKSFIAQIMTFFVEPSVFTRCKSQIAASPVIWDAN